MSKAYEFVIEAVFDTSDSELAVRVRKIIEGVSETGAGVHAMVGDRVKEVEAIGRLVAKELSRPAVAIVTEDGKLAVLLSVPEDELQSVHVALQRTFRVGEVPQLRKLRMGELSAFRAVDIGDGSGGNASGGQSSGGVASGAEYHELTFFINGVNERATSEIRKHYDVANSGGDEGPWRSELKEALGDDVDLRSMKRSGMNGFRVKMRVSGTVDVDKAVASIMADLNCLDVRYASAGELTARAKRYEEAERVLKRDSVDMSDMAGLLRQHGSGKWAKRGVGCLVRAQERAEVRSGAVAKRELDE